MKPLLMGKIKDGLVSFTSSLALLSKPVKVTIKPKKTKAKAKPKAKKKKVEPTEPPKRKTPFIMNELIWARYGDSYYPGVIKNCLGPKLKYAQGWTYVLETKAKQLQGEHVPEENIIPGRVFKLIATDAVKIKEAPFQDALNTAFNANAQILAVYRQGQKRPWCYYIFPEQGMLTHTIQFKGKDSWGNSITDESVVQKKSSEELKLQLLPVAGAPQEILSYLGIHVYGRRWKHVKDTEDVDA